MSDDGLNGFTVIGFVGSVFSPYYKWARRGQATDPENHCAINVALYGTKRRWAMTERGRQHMQRTESHFAVGPSQMEWDGQSLVITLAERGCPMPFEVKGCISITIPHPCAHVEKLDHEGLHHWNPIAPKARATVEMSKPALSWQGTAYVDNNWGSVPLEETFSFWTWARTPTASGAEIVYDVQYTDGSQHVFALSSDDHANVRRVEVPPLSSVPKTRWRVARPAHGRSAPKVVSTLEDTPFYTRSLLQLSEHEEMTLHESLDLRRFNSPVVQMLLPFRMPRSG